MSRGLALPAVACLVLGVVLGIYGWGQRDETRARIVPEEEQVEDGFFDPAPFDEAARVEDTCATLRAASRVESPPLGGPGEGEAAPLQDPALTGFTLLTVLDPDLVLGLPPLDRPDVRAAIEDERRAIEAVVSSGGDVTSDPEVVRTAAVLGLTLDGTC